MIFIGDLHGNFKYLCQEIKKRKDVIYIQVGDFGIGFSPDTDDDNMLFINDILISTNSKLYAIRGNHDDPLYFDGSHDLSNLVFVKDYSVMNIEGNNILFIGGAISIDRKYREKRQEDTGRPCHWNDSIFNYNPELIKNLKDIDIVVTHSTPNIATPYGCSAPIVLSWAEEDETLISELEKERSELTSIYQILKDGGNPISKWVYGHYHFEDYSVVDNTSFYLLDIGQFKTI
jgi:DNA repair exonuclease SbcCD nuclease subunit